MRLRTKITSLTLAVVLPFTAITTVQAEESSTSSTIGSSSSGSESGSESFSSHEGSSALSSENSLPSSSEDKTRIALAIAGVAAVAGLAAAGVTWAVGQRLIANPLPGIIPDPPAPAPAPAPVPAPAPAPAVHHAPAPVPAPAPAPAPVVHHAPAVAPAPVHTQGRRVPPPGSRFRNCTEVRQAGYAPIYRGEPGYRSPLDRDGDGIACDK